MANLRKQVDMAHRIARILEPLLRLLLPPAGRHRPVAECFSEPQRPILRENPTPVPLTRLDQPAVMRPYQAAHELSDEARQQRARHRALWRAAYGVDVGPTRLHGMEAPA